MTESYNDSTTLTLTSVQCSGCKRRVRGELHAHGGSDETLLETIDAKRLEILAESSKNDLTPAASETHFFITPTSSTHGADSYHGEDTEWKKSTVEILLLYTAIGTIIALVHHILYETLSHHPTPAVSLEIGRFTIGPMWALTLGNGLSWLVQLFYTLAISGALVQLFWNLLHMRHFTLREMDRIFSITSAFYTRTALCRATGFAVVATISLGIGGVISTFVPASLAISILPLSQPCDIMTVDFSLPVSSISLENLAAHVLLSQSPMVPTSSPCSNCTYKVDYFAPALTCKEIDMVSSPFNPDTEGHTVLWNATISSNQVSQFPEIFVWSKLANGLTGESEVEYIINPQIILCTLQNASYQVTIDHRNGTSVTAEMDLVPFHYNATTSSNLTAAYSSIGQSFFKLLSGNLDIEQGVLIHQTFVSYTDWVTCIPPNCTRNIDLLTTLPTLMQNMGMSLLARSVAQDNASSFSPLPDGRCLNESPVYVYNRARLLSLYGAALLVTSLCVALGIHSIVGNRGSTLKFSDLVYAIMSPEMMEMSNGRKLPQDTVIHAVRGRFVPGKIL
ncbi:hypothetical protein BD410DRAFT_845002 [Rickenella mellea]|uniref:HMA domain-containing protein n=1 Tax=Rickenella mellea TaxID=50990 RepID=A0A4Y7PMI7_9AGAM|nr:hypothetical protein BD410DRAFT_845002 [Rickenella mellea]